MADGRERILSGSDYRQAKLALQQKMKRRCAPLAAKSSLLGKLVIVFHIQRCVQRHLNKTAPPRALYWQSAVSRSHETSNQALQPTPLPVASLFFMPYPPAMKPRHQWYG